MKGKEKCELLKSIRREIAEKNGIRLEMPECTHKGDCLGSCPRCEYEVRYLEKQLELRRKSGIKPIVAGISAGLITLTASSCIPHPVDELQGDMRAPETTDTTAHDGIESHVTEGSLTYLGTEGDTDAPDTEAYVLDGDIAFNPDDLVLDGDIAFFPKDFDEFELEGVMTVPPEELATAGDLRLPIESSGESVIKETPVTAAENVEIAEDSGITEASTEYAADTIGD